MYENTNNIGGLEAFCQPITVDGATVTLHFASVCDKDGANENRLDAIREILLAAYHAD